MDRPSSEETKAAYYRLVEYQKQLAIGRIAAMAAQCEPGSFVRALKEEMKATDTFLMDTENWLLQWKWPDENRPHPKGPKRFEDERWAELMREALEDSTRVTWDVYKAWCLGGNGDEWFQEE